MNTTRKQEKIIAATERDAAIAARATKGADSAFPVEQHDKDGMTLREYAAIYLKVPDSCKPWLDEMITESLRDEVASKAVHAIMSTLKTTYVTGESLARQAYAVPDNILAVRKGK